MAKRLSESLQTRASGQWPQARYHPGTASRAGPCYLRGCYPCDPVMALSDVSPLTPAGSSAGSSERLVVQLQVLSQLVETLTYRLLELEERLAADEQGVLALREDLSGSGLSEEVEQRLDDTEQRLAGLESLLSGLAPQRSPGGHLQAVSDGHRFDATIDGPFLEEPEQVFMDDMPVPESLLDEDVSFADEPILQGARSDDRLIA